MQKIEALFRLQAVDVETDDKTHRLHDVEARLGESAELLAAREAAAKAAEALHAAEVALREREFEVARTEAKLKSVTTDLYSGKQRPAKDLANLQKEAEHLAHLKSKEEDAELEAMATLEERQAERAQARAALSAAEATWREEQAALLEQQHQLQADLERLAGARTEVLRAVEPAHLPVYESLRKQRAGRAVARVEQSVCSGCRVALPVSQVAKARVNPGLTFCSVCGRILYVAH